MLSYSLAVADAHWLSLNRKALWLIVPSKFYGIAAVGKPIIAIADKNGEIAQLVQRHGCGIVIAPGDADALVDVLRRFPNAPETISEMGRPARAMWTHTLLGSNHCSAGAGLLDQLAKSSVSEAA